MRYLLLLIAAISFKSFSQSSHPVLRIETGMHTGQAKRLAVDSAGKLILTCSPDKTARLWDAADGRLLKTFRIPIGNTDEGTLYACALSPNGKTAALAGITGAEWSSTYWIYIVNTTTGEFIHRIAGLPSDIFDLEFSVDGKWLAAGCTLNNGVTIYETTNWTKFKTLTGYKTEVYNVAFSKSGRFATVCWDGKIRLYDNNFNQVAITGSTNGKQVLNIAFDPTGSLISVAHYDVNNIEIRSATDLKLLYKPSIRINEEEGSLCNVAFSAEGNNFYAGGTFNKTDDEGNTVCILRKWQNKGKGEWMDIQFRNSIQDIKSLPNGQVVVAGAYPELAVIDASGKKTWERSAMLNDFTGPSEQHFRINETGTVVGCTPLYTGVMSFDIQKRQLLTSASNFPSPAYKTSGTVVSNWDQDMHPSINGKIAEFFEANETNLSADISSNGKEVILGTEWNLYKVNNSGKMIWKTPLPDFAWLVNISGNDKVVAAAIADGTLRWYSMEDGKELLSLYFSNDYKRWVLFTPSGYYDASPGAEDILGWHINNGKDQAPSFFPISRFRDKFYRPDIIDLVLQTYNEEQAIALANKTHEGIITTDIQQKRPPTITILSPPNGVGVYDDVIELQYSVSTPGNSPVTSIRALVNGRPVATERGITIKSPKERNKLKVNIPHEDCTITLLAENENGLSPEANIHLVYKKPEKPNTATRPNAYLLVIGISNYMDASLKLNLPAKDARDFAAILKQQEGTSYSKVDVKTLSNTDATKANILDAFDWLSNKAYGKEDVVMIFFAGHGINDNNNIYYMLPFDANIEKLRSSCVNFEELRQTISGIKAKVLVFLDACHSGNVMSNNLYINGLVNMLSGSGTGAVTFTSSTGKEVSYETAEWNNGAFTKALLEGLSGKAQVPGKNKITYKSLDLYVSERVADLTDNKQHPTTVPAPNLPDFLIIHL
jgi:WD40 repeat protein